MKLTHLADFSPQSSTRAWVSVPHPTLPLLATPSSDKRVLVYSLQTFQLHSSVEKGHKRSIRTVAWKPNLPPESLSLVTGSFDATAGVWRRNEAAARDAALGLESNMGGPGADDDEEEEDHDWEFSLVLEGHDSEVKSVAFSPSGQYLATCSRDKSVWIWEEIGGQGDDEWETVAVLQEHEGDVKYLSWCPDDSHGELLASASYDDTVRLWREDSEGEWGCVAILSDHEGTIWGLDWEPQPRRPNGDTEVDVTAGAPPRRLITCSSDATIRVWRQASPADPDSQDGDMPSTIRRKPQYNNEHWICEAILPQVHTRPIYSVSWSRQSGRVVSTGSDSQVVIYQERPRPQHPESIATATTTTTTTTTTSIIPTNANPIAPTTDWHILTTLPLAHGPYEINHAVWCTRFDSGARHPIDEHHPKTQSEMVVTTGDDGLVRAWALEE